MTQPSESLETLSNDAPPADAPPSTPPPAGQANAALEATGFKWGAEAPQFLQGKGPAETLDTVNRLVSAVQHLAQAQQAPQSPQSQPQPQRRMPELNDELLVTDPAEWRRQFQATVEHGLMTQVAQAAAPLYANVAATAAELSRSDVVNKDVAAKWWSEVEAMVAPVPAHMRSKQLYDQAAKMARSNHIDEIASERAAALAAANTGVEGVRSGAPASHADSESTKKSWDKIASSTIGKHMLDKYGKDKIMKAARDMGGLDKYADAIAGTRLEFDPERPGRWYTELHNG